MKRNSILSLIFVVLFLAAGCRKEEPRLLDPINALSDNSWSQIFRSFWTGMNNNYLLWDLDPTDWDAVYEKYSPLFDTLSTTAPYANDVALKYFEEMTSNLIDHHFTLTFLLTNPVKTFNPGFKEVQSRDYYHPPLTFNDLNPIYIKNIDLGRVSEAASFYIDTRTYGIFLALTYLLDGDIAYFYLNQFRLHNYAKTHPEVNSFMANFVKILRQTPNLKGVIIDTRGNGGGLVSDLDWIAGQFVSERKKFGDERAKSGIGRLDYSPWIPTYINPYEEGITPPDVPIVSLVDVNSGSMGEVTAIAIRTLPRGIVIGERTVGALGALTSNFVFLGGEFSNPAIKVETASKAFRTLNGEFLEGKGITPDIIELYDKASFDRKVDNQLERAVRYIRMGN